MKKIEDPRVMLVIIACLWAPAVMDIILSNSSSFGDMSLVGQISVVFGMVPFTYMIFRNLLLPIWHWIKGS